MDSTESTQNAKKQAILTSLANGVSVVDACKAADIDRGTYYLWLANDSDFATKAKAAKLSRIESVRDVAFACALKAEEDPRYQTAMVAYMNNEGDWRNPSKSEVTVTPPKPIAEMTDEELEQFRATIRGRS